MKSSDDSTPINESIFKAYDVRGIYPTDVNEATVKKIAELCLGFFDGDRAVIAHDGRHGGTELAAAAKEGLLQAAAAAGKKITITEVGLTTTPMFYFLVNHLEAAGGIMITASHNPKEYSGMKAVRRGALPISGTELLEVYKSAGAKPSPYFT